MSEVKVNKISPRTNCGTVQLGDSGDTITIPAGATITNNGTAAGFGSTGEISWDTTKKTATFTAVSGVGYFCDTSGGAITVNLPAGTAGNSFAVADYTNTFQTNNLTITPNGSQKLGGISASQALSTEGQSVTFVYVDDTEGWKNVQDSTSNVTGNPFIVATGGTITTCGNCKIHTFTGPGTFCVSQVHPCAANNEVSYMVVAGGGGGGGFQGGGGAGAGGFREDKSPITPYTASPLDGAGPITVTATAFPITVGGGGAGGPAADPVPQPPGDNGSNSVFSTITSAGGGGGGRGGGPCGSQNGANGGSGGGGGGRSGQGSGSGNTPPVSPPQGNPGGSSKPEGSPSSDSGGGGGGATAAGSNGQNDSSPAGNGGNGATTSISGSPTTYAGGGGGAREVYPNGTGGTGGGGNGTENATANTGGGGGGGNGEGFTGGSGIVIIRYKYQ